MSVITVRIEYDSQVGGGSIPAFCNQPAVARPCCVNGAIRENYWRRSIIGRLCIFVLEDIFPIGVI